MSTMHRISRWSNRNLAVICLPSIYCPVEQTWYYDRYPHFRNKQIHTKVRESVNILVQTYVTLLMTHKSYSSDISKYYMSLYSAYIRCVFEIPEFKLISAYWFIPLAKFRNNTFINRRDSEYIAEKTTIWTRGQPATIIPRPARVIEILQGAYFTEVSHSVLQ